MHYESNNTIIILLTLLTFSVEAQKISEWRRKTVPGICRNRSDEVMAATGPTLLWSNLDLAKVIHHHHLEPVPYIYGNTATNDAKDILFALNMDGKILWQTEMGRAWTGSNPESRATPMLNQIEYIPVVGLVILHASTRPQENDLVLQSK